MEVISTIDKLIITFLKPYLETLEEFYSSVDQNVIEIHCLRNKEDKNRFMLLRMGINFDNEEFYIYNIHIPIEDRRKGLGYGLIAFIYEIAKKLGFALVIADMTENFRKKMVSRGAKKTKIYDCLQVVDTTDLKVRSNIP
jgi:hypothetical protein